MSNENISRFYSQQHRHSVSSVHICTSTRPLFTIWLCFFCLPRRDAQLAYYPMELDDLAKYDLVKQETLIRFRQQGRQYNSLVILLPLPDNFRPNLCRHSPIDSTTAPADKCLTADLTF
ncbi:uncharacterized [Tachysurus ichikawai]